MTPEEKEVALLEGEIATRIHIQDVSHLLIDVAEEFLYRSKYHDESKLDSEEHEKFSIAAARFKEPGNEFGSEGYNKTKEWLGDALNHHYMHNSHHPEHYPDRFQGMNLFDILEMLADWKAASSRRTESGKLDLDKLAEIHKVPKDLMVVIENTAKYLEYC